MLPLESTASASNAIQRVKYSHDAMIDIIIAQPEVTQKTLSEYFGYTQAWVSRIICSDAFQARLAQRRGEIVTPGIVATFEERLKGLANQSLDILAEKLEETDEDGNSTVEVGTAIKALEMSAKALGYGARQTNVAIQNNMTVNSVSDDQLMQIANGEIIDGS